MKRILIFDIMKAICVIEIVAFWHMFDYTSINADNVMFGNDLTSAVLAAFTFSSGFFLGKKQVDVRTFYKTRLKRFMLPLLASLLVFWLFGNISLKTMLLSTTGLSCFIPPMAPTLWFFSMIILYYLFTPFFLYGIGQMNKTDRIIHILISSFLVYAVFLLLGVDERIQHYFLFYTLGMLADMECVRSISSVNICYKIGGGIVWLVCSYVGVPVFITDCLGILILIFISEFIEEKANEKSKLLLCKISYASMFAYLFHRQFYQIAKRLFATPNETIPYYGIIITVILIFILSYYGQKIYDKIVTKL